MLQFVPTKVLKLTSLTKSFPSPNLLCHHYPFRLCAWSTLYPLTKRSFSTPLSPWMSAKVTRDLLMASPLASPRSSSKCPKAHAALNNEKSASLRTSLCTLLETHAHGWPMFSPEARLVDSELWDVEIYLNVHDIKSQKGTQGFFFFFLNK